MLSILSRIPVNASMAINLIITVLSFTIIIIAWCLTDRYKAVDQDTMVKSGFVVVYKQVYLLTAYINIALICGIATAGKFLSWTEIHNLLSRRYQTRECIYGFSKGMHAFIGNVVMTAVAICDPRVINRGKIWATIYIFCFLLAVFNALISTAVPQLLQKDVTLVNITKVRAQINSTIMPQKIYEMASSSSPEEEGGIDNAAYMARQVHDGKYLWEKIYQDAYDPKNRTYTYISNWGHASVDETTDKSYPKSSPMTGKTLDVKGLDGFLSSIKCHVIPCHDCSPTLDTHNQDYLTPSKMGVTNLTFYSNYSGIQYRVFWGNGVSGGNAIGVADVNKTGMIREANFYPQNDAKDGYNYFLLLPGRIKVNCDFGIYTHNGNGNKTDGRGGSEKIFINNTRYFDHIPFADPMFTKYSATLDPQTVNSLLSEENILRNLTYNMHNAFRLLNDKLFRTQGYISKVANSDSDDDDDDGAEIEWAVKTNMRGYDLSIMAYATVLLAITFIVYLLELITMIFSKRLMPLISYTQEIDTRLSVVALSGVLPPDDANPSITATTAPRTMMFGGNNHRNKFFPRETKTDPITGIPQEDIRLKNQGNILRKDSVFRWYKDSFVPEITHQPSRGGDYQMEMDALRQMQERNLTEAEQRRYYEHEVKKLKEFQTIRDSSYSAGTLTTETVESGGPSSYGIGECVKDRTSSFNNNSSSHVNQNPEFLYPSTLSSIGQEYQNEREITDGVASQSSSSSAAAEWAASTPSLGGFYQSHVRFSEATVIDQQQIEDTKQTPPHRLQYLENRNYRDIRSDHHHQDKDQQQQQLQQQEEKKEKEQSTKLNSLEITPKNNNNEIQQVHQQEISEDQQIEENHSIPTFNQLPQVTIPSPDQTPLSMEIPIPYLQEEEDGDDGNTSPSKVKELNN
ncbi:hypothetical protein H4219_002662 [Mycoemilia scoparia]|uniref:Uncharacterized protein n=1 Tax=Mycoemilia scoparia TaxID=417184 RepID=A0A9W7ZXQ7_9FUNG|nr:hypothetical protein H4219_002662 [Mycoemilia scoparia]